MKTRSVLLQWRQPFCLFQDTEEIIKEDIKPMVFLEVNVHKQTKNQTKTKSIVRWQATREHVYRLCSVFDRTKDTGAMAET